MGLLYLFAGIRIGLHLVRPHRKMSGILDLQEMSSFSLSPRLTVTICFTSQTRTPPGMNINSKDKTKKILRMGV